MKPPMKTTAMIKPIFEELGCPIASEELGSIELEDRRDFLPTFNPRIHGLKASHDNLVVTDSHLRNEDTSLPKDQLSQPTVSPPLGIGVVWEFQGSKGLSCHDRSHCARVLSMLVGWRVQFMFNLKASHLIPYLLEFT
jgi:hypothetical protein